MFAVFVSLNNFYVFLSFLLGLFFCVLYNFILSKIFYCVSFILVLKLQLMQLIIEIRFFIFQLTFVLIQVIKH